jgi:hypothetical protein
MAVVKNVIDVCIDISNGPWILDPATIDASQPLLRCVWQPGHPWLYPGALENIQIPMRPKVIRQPLEEPLAEA